MYFRIIYAKFRDKGSGKCTFIVHHCVLEIWYHFVDVDMIEHLIVGIIAHSLLYECIDIGRQVSLP